jgi:polyisoprenoid-binding protein YceI
MIVRSAFAAALALAPLSLWATTYTLEPNHAEGIIRWSHLDFSHPTAQFTRVEGTLEFDPAHPERASVKAVIPLANVSSGVPDLDENLRSSAFFDLPRNASATFESTKVEKTSMPDRLKVTGNFSVHGVTRPVVLEVTINKVGANPRLNLAAVGFEATTTLKRSDFGLGKFIPQVSDEITIHITAQANEAAGYAAYLKAEADEAAAAAKASRH